MDTISILLNKRPVSIQDSIEVIKQLEKDDEILIDYVCRAVSMGRIEFCSIQDLATLSIERIQTPVFDVLPGVAGPSSQSEEIVQAPETTEYNPINLNVWTSKGKPTKEDKEATFQLLQLRGSGKYTKKFNNKSSVKLQLWKEIANQLVFIGYDVNASSCRQKFTNLYKQYIKHKQHLKTTGAERKEPPEFYEQMDAILGQKDKVNLSHTVDSMECFSTEPQTSQVVENMLNIDICDTSSSSKSSEISEANGTKNENTLPKKHKVTKVDIIETLNRSTEKQMDQQKTEFNILMEAIKEQNSLLKEQNQQRADFLKIMKEFLNPRKQ